MPTSTRRAAFTGFIAMFASRLRAPPCGAASDRTFIRTPDRRVLGELRTRHDGVVEARAARGRFLGTYDSRTDTTRDERGRLLTYGDTLSALIMQKA